jgi:acyl-CoA thioesterase-2
VISVAHSLSAAQHTVEGRIAHSLHAYFLRRGDMKAPIIYEVDRARDGGSFSTRRVVAIQHGRPIFNLAASFQIVEPGIEHQAAMPDVPGPAGLKDISAVADAVSDRLPQKMRRFLTDKRPFEFRPVGTPHFIDPKPQEPSKSIWIKAVDELPANHALHQNLLAYVSDYELLGTATLPHGLPFGRGKVIMASLDHALWFHHAIRVGPRPGARPGILSGRQTACIDGAGRPDTGGRTGQAKSLRPAPPGLGSSRLPASLVAFPAEWVSGLSYSVPTGSTTWLCPGPQRQQRPSPPRRDRRETRETAA